MGNLLQALRNADGICGRANVHFEKEAVLENRAAVQESKIKTVRKIMIISTILGGLVMESAFHISVPGVLWCGLGAAVYFFIKHAIKTKAHMLRGQAQEENAAGLKIFEDNYESVAFLPDDYWYPLATGYLIKVVQAQRAGSLKEALDMLDAQLHRWKVEEANAEMVAQQQAQTAHLKSIRTSSKINAVANVMNTMNTMNNMYN